MLFNLFWHYNFFSFCIALFERSISGFFLGPATTLLLNWISKCCHILYHDFQLSWRRFYHENELHVKMSNAVITIINDTPEFCGSVNIRGYPFWATDRIRSVTNLRFTVARHTDRIIRFVSDFIRFHPKKLRNASRSTNKGLQVGNLSDWVTTL